MEKSGSGITSISEEMDDDLAALFSMSNVSGWTDEDDMRGAADSIVGSSRFVLDKFGRGSFQEDYLASVKDPADASKDGIAADDPFDLFDSRLIPPKKAPPSKRVLQVNSLGSTLPLMPCAIKTLENVDREFYEPVRDRDKDYKAEQMNILDEVMPVDDYATNYMVKHHGQGEAEEKGSSPDKKKRGLLVSKSVPKGLKLGKYHINTQVPPNFWSPQFQQLIRKTKLMRCTRYISETYCVIDVYGIGISGRVFSGGPGRMLIIEAYSTWNSEKHIMILTVPMMLELLSKQSDLFKAGNKQKLVETIVSYLYFSYTIEPAPVPDTDGDSRSRSTTRNAMTRGSTAQRVPTAGMRPFTGVSRPVTGFGDGEGLDELVETEEFDEGDEMESEPGTGRELVDDMSAISMQEEEEGEKEYMTAREARIKSRLENENDPKYLGLIPCDVAAPENLADWLGAGLRDVWQQERDERLRVTEAAERPVSQGSQHDFQLFEPGSPPSSAKVKVVDAPNSEGGWEFPPLASPNEVGLDNSRKNSVRDSNRSLNTISPLVTDRSVLQGNDTARSKTSHSTLNTRQSAISEMLDKLMPKPDFRVQTVEDIEEPRKIRPDFPTYPVTVSQIIRALSDSATEEESIVNWKGYGLPTLKQELKVGTTLRPSARLKRRVAERLRVEKEEKEEEARKAAWLAIPPMKRGLRMKRCIYSQGRLVVLSAYIFPHKPTNVVIKGHVVGECKNLMLNLSLSTIGSFYGETRPPKNWPPELIDPLLKQALSEVECKLTGNDPRDGLCSLKIRDTIAFEAQLSALQKIKIQQPFLDLRATTKDYRQLAWTQGGVTDMHTHRVFPPSKYIFRDLAYPRAQTPNAGNREEKGKVELLAPYYPMPRRHLSDKMKKRMFTQALHIQGTSCICSVYFSSDLIPFPKEAPVIEKPKPTQESQNQPNQQNAVIEKEPLSQSQLEEEALKFGNIPVPRKKVRKFIQVFDAAYEERRPRLEMEQNLWGKMVADEKAAREKADADAKEAERKRIHEQRVAMYNHLEDLKHSLTPEEFRKKYFKSHSLLDEQSFKALWSMEHQGLWHHVYLHLLNDKLAREVEEDEIKLAALIAEERAADVERFEKEEAERMHQQAILEEKQRKVHEYRHNLLHAVQKRDGESHEDFMMRRMKEAIAMKKASGLLELDDLNEPEEEPGDKDDDEVEEVEVVPEVESDGEEDEDWLNENAVTPGAATNDYMDGYAPGFELELELYFPEDAFAHGRVIPAQRVIRHMIRREDVYRIVPTMAERFDVLRIAYACFFELSSEFEIKAMFRKWQDIIVRRYLLGPSVRWTLLSAAELKERQHLKDTLLESDRAIRMQADEAMNAEDPRAEIDQIAASGKIYAEVAAAESGEKMPISEPKISDAPAESKDPKVIAAVDSDQDSAVVSVAVSDEASEEDMSIGDDEDFGEMEEDDDGATVKPYVPPDPPLTQKEQAMARIRLFEHRSDYASLPVFKQKDAIVAASHAQSRLMVKNNTVNAENMTAVDDADINADAKADADAYAQAEGEGENDCTANKDDISGVFSFASSLVAEANKDPGIPYLTWAAPGSSERPHAAPKVVFRRMALIKTNKSTLAFGQPHGFVKMLVEVWVRGQREMGIWAYDVRRGHKMYTVPLDSETQAGLASKLEYMPQKERNDFLSISCSVELLFNKTTCSDGVDRFMVEFKQDPEAEEEEWVDEEPEEEIDFVAEAMAAKEKLDAENIAKAEKMADVKKRLAAAKAAGRQEFESERQAEAVAESEAQSGTAQGDDQSIISALTKAEGLPSDDEEDEEDEDDDEDDNDEDEGDEEEEGDSD